MPKKPLKIAKKNRIKQAKNIKKHAKNREKIAVFFVILYCDARVRMVKLIL